MKVLGAKVSLQIGMNSFSNVVVNAMEQRVVTHSATLDSTDSLELWTVGGEVTFLQATETKSELRGDQVTFSESALAENGAEGIVRMFVLAAKCALRCSGLWLRWSTLDVLDVLLLKG